MFIISFLVNLSWFLLQVRKYQRNMDMEDVERGNEVPAEIKLLYIKAPIQSFLLQTSTTNLAPHVSILFMENEVTWRKPAEFICDN